MVEESLRVLCAEIIQCVVVSCVQKLYNVLSFFIVFWCFFYKRDQDCILSGSLYSRKLLVARRR
jgi:hypothetical protein